MRSTMESRTFLITLLVALAAIPSETATALNVRAAFVAPKSRQLPAALQMTRATFAPPKPTIARTQPNKEDAIDLLTKHRSGGWLPKNSRAVANFIQKLKSEAALKPQALVEPVETLGEMIRQDKRLAHLANEMFIEAAKLESKTPLGTPSVKDLDEFLLLLNHIITTMAPEFTCSRDPSTGALDPCGLIGFPINALLDWPMATSSGYAVFSNQLVNQQFKKILSYWTNFLTSYDSTYTFTKEDLTSTPVVKGWLSDYAKKTLTGVACEATGSKITSDMTFEQIFQCDPSSRTNGYNSWNEFFTRNFRAGIRPVADPDDDSVIVSACEAAPLQNVTNVQSEDKFWLKGQPYSLQNMMDFHPLAEKFTDGTVYQAFLSALSYHCWNSPVSGTVVDAFLVNGAYYLENIYQGFKDGNQDPDDSGPNDSQPFLTAVASRAVIFIEADNPDIGLMCFIAVGMAEVNSCEVTLTKGQHIQKGDPLGKFHFGGSTHCLLFRKETKLDFIQPPVVGLNATNIAVGSFLARASSN